LALAVQRLSAACRAYGRSLVEAKDAIRAFDLLAHNVTATPDAESPINEPGPELSFHNFAAAIAGRASYIHALPPPSSSEMQAS